MIVYADILFAINFSMDFLALFTCSMLVHARIARSRMIIASLVGAFYGIINLAFEKETIFSLILSILIAFVMCYISFSERKFKGLLVTTALFLIVSMLLGGIMSFVYSTFNAFLYDLIKRNEVENVYINARLFMIIGITAILSILFSRTLASKRNTYTANLKIDLRGNCFDLVGFCDSGNLLTEPFSGKPVILVPEKSKLGEIILNNSEYKRKLIPYKDVSGEGVLIGILPEKLVIDGKQKDAIIAATKNKDFNGFGALVPKALL